MRLLWSVLHFACILYYAIVPAYRLAYVWPMASADATVD
jgi:hypothetical protein